MPYTAVRTDDEIQIRDGDDIIATFDTWPPKDAEGLETLFNDANISTPQKGLFKILFGVAEVKDERSDTEAE